MLVSAKLWTFGDLIVLKFIIIVIDFGATLGSIQGLLFVATHSEITPFFAERTICSVGV